MTWRALNINTFCRHTFLPHIYFLLQYSNHHLLRFIRLKKKSFQCRLKINKDKKVRNSKWHIMPLSPEQQIYAAIDVYVSSMLSVLHLSLVFVCLALSVCLGVRIVCCALCTCVFISKCQRHWGYVKEYITNICASVRPFVRVYVFSLFKKRRAINFVVQILMMLLFHSFNHFHSIFVFFSFSCWPDIASDVLQIETKAIGTRGGSTEIHWRVWRTSLHRAAKTALNARGRTTTTAIATQYKSNNITK